MFPKEQSPFFSIRKLNFNQKTKKIEEEIVKDTFELDFLMQKQSRISELIEKNKLERKSIVDLFSWISWTIALIVIIIEILKMSKIIVIDTTDLAIIGSCIGLIILPFANKLKFLGMEFERFEFKKIK